MRNTEYKFTVTNRHTNEHFYDFEGTEYQFALSFADLDRHVDVGYPHEIISTYRHLILQDAIDEDRVSKFESAIAKLETMDTDSVAVVSETGGKEFEITNVEMMDLDYSVSRENLVQELEVGVNYFIDAVKDNNNSNNAKWSDWDSANHIINTYTIDDRYKYVFVGGMESVAKDLGIELAKNVKIESFVEAYETKSKPLKELLATAKTFDSDMKSRLEDVLLSKDISIDKLVEDLKSSDKKNKLKI